MSIFKGSAVAICTPFDGEEKFNAVSYEKLLKFHVESKTDAILACGTTGETSTLYFEEHVEVVRTAVETVKRLSAGKRKIPVIAGAGGNDTRHCIQLGKKLVEAGVDACMYVTPYYNKTSQRGLVEHYSKIASEVNVPIIIYNIVGRTGLNMLPTTFQKLAKIENIAAVKEASGIIAQVAEIAELCGDDLDIYSGNDDYILPILSLGGKGVISTVANLIPNEVHDLVYKFFDGDAEGSRKLQLGMLPLVRAIFSDVNPIPVKEALNMMGFNAGKCRMPLTTMDEGPRAEMKKRMLEYGLVGLKSEPHEFQTCSPMQPEIKLS